LYSVVVHAGGKTERYQQNLRRIVRRREDQARMQALKRVLRWVYISIGHLA
jgi:hypothetical protein